IRPVDTTAPLIKSQVNLPVSWNGKSVQMGGSSPPPQCRRRRARPARAARCWRGPPPARCWRWRRRGECPAPRSDWR
ncbi:MAG: tannase/feruloyl esterase family alpha/beta hydrolase, partial [Starkeya sp.]|nr:tannase/feruloyl esterase family alpha/beta hydrolase [Starkeya sp.]